MYDTMDRYWLPIATGAGEKSELLFALAGEVSGEEKVSQILRTSYNTADTLHVRHTGVPQPFSF